MVAKKKRTRKCDICDEPATTTQGIYDTCKRCKPLVKKNSPNKGF